MILQKGRQFRRQRVFNFHFLKKQSPQLQAALLQPLENNSANQVLLPLSSSRLFEGEKEWTCSSGSVWPAGRQKRQAKVVGYPGELSRPAIISALATQGARKCGCQRAETLPSCPPPHHLPAWARGAAAHIFRDMRLLAINLGPEPDKVTHWDLFTIGMCCFQQLKSHNWQPAVQLFPLAGKIVPLKHIKALSLP